MVASRRRLGFCCAPGALGITIFIDQGLTPGNIDIHPKASLHGKLTKPGQPLMIGPLWLIGMGLTAKRFKICAKYIQGRNFSSRPENILIK